MVNKAYIFARTGSKDKAIFDVLGISKTTYYDYLDQAETYRRKAKLTPDQKLIMDFSDSIKKGRAERENEAISTIQKAADKSWQAAAWYLERSNPEDWGQKIKTDNTHKGDKNNPLNINNINKPIEELLRDV